MQIVRLLLSFKVKRFNPVNFSRFEYKLNQNRVERRRKGRDIEEKGMIERRKERKKEILVVNDHLHDDHHGVQRLKKGGKKIELGTHIMIVVYSYHIYSYQYIPYIFISRRRRHRGENPFTFISVSHSIPISVIIFFFRSLALLSFFFHSLALHSATNPFSILYLNLILSFTQSTESSSLQIVCSKMCQVFGRVQQE